MRVRESGITRGTHPTDALVILHDPTDRQARVDVGVADVDTPHPDDHVVERMAITHVPRIEVGVGLHLHDLSADEGLDRVVGREEVLGGIDDLGIEHARHTNSQHVRVDPIEGFTEMQNITSWSQVKVTNGNKTSKNIIRTLQ